MQNRAMRSINFTACFGHDCINTDPSHHASHHSSTLTPRNMSSIHQSTHGNTTSLCHLHRTAHPPNTEDRPVNTISGPYAVP